MQTKIAIELVERLLEEEEWSLFFQFSCECGPDRLTSQVWQWHQELTERGHRVTKVEIEDALLELAHELLPDSPAGDDPYTYLFNHAARWVTSSAKPFETTDAEDEELNNALYVPLPEYREALRAWLRAGLERGKGIAA